MVAPLLLGVDLPVWRFCDWVFEIVDRASEMLALPFGTRNIRAWRCADQN
jgi:hypothetical protein